MNRIKQEISKDIYEESVTYEQAKNNRALRNLAEKVAGADIVYGYGLYSFGFHKDVVDGKEKYTLSMLIGNTCD